MDESLLHAHSHSYTHTHTPLPSRTPTRRRILSLTQTNTRSIVFDDAIISAVTTPVTCATTTIGLHMHQVGTALGETPIGTITHRELVHELVGGPFGPFFVCKKCRSKKKIDILSITNLHE